MLYPKKTKNPNPSPIGNRFGFFLFGGRGWIRTTEAEKQQIYSLSPLATREHAQILFTSLPDDSFILADKSGFVNRFFAFFQLLFSSAKKWRSLAEILRFGCVVLRTIHGAGRLPCSGFQMFPALIVPEGLNGLTGKRIERDEVEDGHQADAHIAKVPHDRVGLHTAHQQHPQRQYLIKGLPEPAVPEEIRHIGAGVEQDTDEGGKAEQRQRHGDEDDAEAAQMVLHRRLQEVHAGQARRDGFRGQQHDEGRAAANDDRINEDAQRLDQPHLDRVIAFGSCGRAGCRAAARLVGEQAALDTVHQNGTKAARRHLPQAEGFREDAAQHRREVGDIGRDDIKRHHKIAARHHRHNDVQAFHGGVLAQHDDCRQHHQCHRRCNGRDVERILERRAHRVADDLADSAPADEARQRKQHRDHRSPQRFLPLPLRPHVDIIGRAAALAAVERVGLSVLLGQGGFHKRGGRAQQGRDPHPEHCACATGRHRRHNAHQIAHAHAGGRGNDEGLERRKTVPALVFLADGRDHRYPWRW